MVNDRERKRAIADLPLFFIMAGEKSIRSGLVLPEDNPDAAGCNFQLLSAEIIEMNGDALGASPRRCGAPVAIVSYYPTLDSVCDDPEESQAPPPPLGAGLAQGEEFVWKEFFYRADKRNAHSHSPTI